MIEQLIIEGLAIGACYGLFGVAVAIIYKTSEVVNFAQGEMGMIATFVAFHVLNPLHLPFWLAFIITMVFAMLLGMSHRDLLPAAAKDPTVLGLIIITLGVEMLLMGLAGWKWGAEQKDFPFRSRCRSTHGTIPGLSLNEWSIGVFVLTAVSWCSCSSSSGIPGWASPCGPPSRM